MQAQQLHLKAFLPETASEKEFDDAIHLQLTKFKEDNPQDPPPPEHMIRKSLEMLAHNPMFNVEIHLAYDGSEISVGGIFIAYPKPDSPDYEAQKHMAFGSPLVLPEHRRKGIGTELLKFATAQLQERSLTLFQGDTNDDAGRAFAKQFGAEVGIEAKDSRAQVADLNWEMIEEWVAKGEATNPDVTIELFVGLPNDDDIEAYSALYTEVFNQQPFDQIEGGEQTWTPEKLREIHERMQEMGTTDYIMVTREADGSFSGLTELTYNPERSHRTGQGLTGVYEQHRGRGLGKWLKAKMLLYMREHFPTVEHVATTNASSNAAMLSINERLGFKLYKHETVYKVPVERLQAYFS